MVESSRYSGTWTKISNPSADGAREMGMYCRDAVWSDGIRRPMLSAYPTNSDVAWVRLVAVSTLTSKWPRMADRKPFSITCSCLSANPMASLIQKIFLP